MEQCNKWNMVFDISSVLPDCRSQGATVHAGQAWSLHNILKHMAKIAALALLDDVTKYAPIGRGRGNAGDGSKHGLGS